MWKMVREIVIGLYLILFKIQFNFFKLLPIKEKVTFVGSYGQNSIDVYKEMARQQIKYDVVFLCKPGSDITKDQYGNVKVLAFETINIVDMIRSIFHLATSKYVIVDNYFGFLAVTNFKEEVQCIQLWHAVGAVKQFGLKDKSVPFRTKKTQQRFTRVYEKFHKVVVGSDAMANVFQEAFNIPMGSFLRTGIPRTDLFFDKLKQNEVINNLLIKNPNWSEKKVILYAPTFRDNQLDHFQLKMDFELMQRALGDEYILLLKLHPALRNHTNYKNLFSDFVYDCSSYRNVNELLLITDVLITDYSSIPYEYALLNRPMIFFAYDLEEYQEQRGLWEDYKDSVPGPITNNTQNIVDIIKEDNFDLEQIRRFSRKWNQYSRGDSSRNLVEYLVGQHQETLVRGVL
jgi:CDP-glycerol glycerophosphotransferase (TagB/SpsB family)